MKQYDNNKKGKREFVAEVLSPFLIQTQPSYKCVEYQEVGQDEYVLLISYGDAGASCKYVDVTRDSIVELVRDVMKYL